MDILPNLLNFILLLCIYQYYPYNSNFYSLTSLIFQFLLSYYYVGYKTKVFLPNLTVKAFICTHFIYIHSQYTVYNVYIYMYS